MGKVTIWHFHKKNTTRRRQTERFLAAAIIFGAIERNAIRSTVVCAGVHVRKREKNHSLIPFVSQMCAWHERA